MTDTEKDALCTRIDELCAELGKTQLSLDMWHDRAEDMRNRLLAAHVENAKLRELAVLNWEWTHSCCANSCKMQTDGCGYGIDRECNYEREIADRMRDLGIEVGE